MSFPEPHTIGLPEKIAKWRPSQVEALQWLLKSTARVKALCAPTGFGKSPLIIAYILMTGKPTCIVTDNRGLQDQYLADYAGIGLVDIRGRRNYTCDLRPGYTCEDGYAARCPHKGTISCPSSQAEMRAAVSPLVITNYDKWTAARKYGQGMDHFQQVVFDEGHKSTAALERAMQVTLHHRELAELGVDLIPHSQTDEFVNWKPWASIARAEAESQMNAVRAQLAESHPKQSVVREYLHLRNLTKRLATIATANPQNWIADEAKDGYQFDPIRPGRYSEGVLLLRVPSILVVSATLRPKTLYMIGIGNKQMDFKEFDSDFDPARCPIYYVPTMRVDKSAHDLSQLWLRLDQIAARRTDRKGIVHTICVAPSTKIITSDLRWVRADSVVVGQSLLGFDEFPSTRQGGSRQWRESIVEDVDIIERPCVRLELGDGTIVTCSQEHLWLTHNGAVPRWTRSDRLMVGPKYYSHLMRVLPVWSDPPDDWRHGYLAAALEGEGSLHQKNYERVGKSGLVYCRSLSVGFAQNMGSMLSRVMTTMTDLGFHPTLYSNRVCKNLRVNHKSEVLRLLGQIRPERLLSKLDITRLGKFSLLERVPVISRQNLGNHKVVFIKTNTGTFIADGFASHNSYARRDEILMASRFRDSMMINNKGEAPTWMVDEFKRAKPGTILVSPSVGAGYDFPGRDCEWQFVCKIPFPDSRSKIIKARQEDDKEYGPYAAITTLVQAFGRGARSRQDQSEGFIGDMHLDWFLPRYGHLAPKSFHRFFKRVDVLPQPPPRL